MKTVLPDKKSLIVGVLCAIGCECLFGFSFLFTKKAMGIVSPLDLLGWRFTVAFVFMTVCLLCHAFRLSIRGRALLPIIGLGLLFPGGYHICEAYGIRLTTASESGIVIAIVPVVILALSALILKEKPAVLQIMGILISIAGVILCAVAKGMTATFSLPGYFMLIGGVCFFSFFSVLSKKAPPCSSLEKTYVIVTVAFILYGGAALLKNAAAGRLPDYLMLPFRQPDVAISALYLGIVCSALSVFLCNKAIALIGAARTASFIGVETVVCILAGVLILKESFYPLQSLGTILVIGGVYLANVIRRNSRTQAS